MGGREVKKLPKWFVLLCILLAGCGDISLRGVLATAVAEAKIHHILMVGNLQVSSTDPQLYIPCYWLDGVLALLPTGSQPNGEIDTPLVNGSDIFIFGCTLNGSASLWPSTSEIPVYWKNGVLNTLPYPAGTYGFARQGLFDSSGNLYIMGFVNSTSTGNSIPGYWKNGVWTPLSMTLSSGTAPYGITLGQVMDSSGNIISCGSLTDPVTGLNVPVYWKNGVVNQISLASVAGATHGGQVANYVPPPYVSTTTILLEIFDANFNSIPAYMVNGQITMISTGSETNGDVWWVNQSSSGDLYATGMVGTWGNITSSPVGYWKNWSIVSLPTPNGQPYGQSGGAIFVGNDWYMDGQTSNSSGYRSVVYWKNGNLVVMPNTGYFGATEGGLAFLY
jgi:hypothetical protein